MDTLYIAMCAGVGVALILHATYQRRELRASRNWLKAMGTVREAGLQNYPGDRNYHIQLLYEYDVNGVRYTGKRIEFGRRGYARRKSADTQLARYPVNSSVIVFFNPEKPEEAVLERNAPYSSFSLLMGLLSLAFALSILGLKHAGY